MVRDRDSFGATVRHRREERKIGLRQMAKMIDVSPTYLSRVERDEFDPPTEDRVVKIADLLGFDRDELLALAGRTPAELQEIIRAKPRAIGALLRAVRDLEGVELERIVQRARAARNASHLSSAISAVLDGVKLKHRAQGVEDTPLSRSPQKKRTQKKLSSFARQAKK